MTRAKDIRDTVAEVLRDLHWPEQPAADLAASAHVITYEKGSSIFHAGEPADLLYVLLSGEVKLYYANVDGDRLLVDIARSRQALGYLQLHVPEADEATQKFSAEALSRCIVALITRTRIASTARSLPAKAITQMVQHLSVEWARVSERALRYLTMDVRGRLVVAIEDIAERFGIADARGTLIPLRLSHEDFGELIGASRPMVSKHLKELADAGVFFKANGRYVLARREGLQTRARRTADVVAVEIEAARRPARAWRAAPALEVVRGKLHAPVRKAAH
jgi:CRP-like cAMP-binding protein